MISGHHGASPGTFGVLRPRHTHRNLALEYCSSPSTAAAGPKRAEAARVRTIWSRFLVTPIVAMKTDQEETSLPHEWLELGQREQVEVPKGGTRRRQQGDEASDPVKNLNELR